MPRIPATDAPAVIAGSTAGCVCTVRLWIIALEAVSLQGLHGEDDPERHTAR
ncbi:hypothetical protein [Streptomyces sp. NPDC048643]|uniref:hypothetical protein n=1 Tax=Streptomyces sp. NPDC048643 TaxID=3155637 RepID=UPI00341E80EA